MCGVSLLKSSCERHGFNKGNTLHVSNESLVSLAAPAGTTDPLTDLLRSGARRSIGAAVSAKFEEYLSAFMDEKLPDGRQRVVRNRHLPVRRILTGLGEVEVRVPKAHSGSGSPERFRSSVVPPCVRRCASLDAAIPWLYLHGVSSGQPQSRRVNNPPCTRFDSSSTFVAALLPRLSRLQAAIHSGRRNHDN